MYAKSLKLSEELESSFRHTVKLIILLGYFDFISSLLLSVEKYKDLHCSNHILYYLLPSKFYFAVENSLSIFEL